MSIKRWDKGKYMVQIIQLRISRFPFIFREIDLAKDNRQTSSSGASIQALDAAVYSNESYSGEILYNYAKESKGRILLSLEEACYTGDPTSIFHNDF
ncbi:MAG: hypothetical protein ACXAEI_06915 [Candidatus Hodarchaeales archaeon]|jgi:hypothetical protein